MASRVGAGVWQTFWLAQTGGPGVPGRRRRHQTHQPDPHDSPRPGCIAARPTGQRTVDFGQHGSPPPPPSAQPAANLTRPQTAPTGEPLTTPGSRSTSTGSPVTVHKSAGRRHRPQAGRATVLMASVAIGDWPQRAEGGDGSAGTRQTRDGARNARRGRLTPRCAPPTHRTPRTTHNDSRSRTTQQPPHDRGFLLIAQRQAGNESECFAEVGVRVTGEPSSTPIDRRLLPVGSVSANSVSAEFSAERVLWVAASAANFGRYVILAADF
jgi:hypothetical protein